AIDLLHSRYHDFGPTLAHEKLTEAHELILSVESVRQIMILEELWKPRKVRRKAVHQMRQRRACLGELVQIDGSRHAWFEDRGPACTLLVYIDDATGRLLELFFVPVESTFAYFVATRRYLHRHGEPVSFYSDQNSIFKLIAGFGCRLIQNRKGHPEENAHVERSHRTDDDEFYKLKALEFRSEQELLEQATLYIHYYNNVREHSSLHYQTPFDHLIHQQPDIDPNIRFVQPLILDDVSVALGPWSGCNVLAQHP
ncbi:MAG: integrase core domain-containing protein, partial [Anaerolineales bacterium]|nr:integrase core domain-containing protein [Anaerolineales bacterium]